MFFAALGLVAVGIMLGFLGAGGTAIALPVLVYWVGLEPHAAVAVSLLLVGSVCAVGVVLQSRRGMVSWRDALGFAPFGVAGAILGSKWSYLLSGRALLLTFSGLLAVIGVKMLIEKHLTAREDHRHNWPLIAVAGFCIGLLTGALGVGGGFLIVPAMIYFAGLAIREAIGTSLVLIALNSLSAFAGHISQQRLAVPTLLFLFAAAVAGMMCGVKLSHTTDPRRLRKGFGCLLLVLAGFMTYRNL